MKTSAGFGPTSYPSWVFVALALSFLTACATTRSAEEGQPEEVETGYIGYGSVDKDHQAGSVTTISSEDLKVVNTKTLAEMLGRISGIRVMERPGGEISVRVRGTNSILAGEEPLWVIDGMVIQSGLGLSGINPNSIESISVLKNAGETAIYGSRGANGVILIKTKKGSK